MLYVTAVQLDINFSICCVCTNRNDTNECLKLRDARCSMLDEFVVIAFFSLSLSLSNNNKFSFFSSFIKSIASHFCPIGLCVCFFCISLSILDLKGERETISSQNLWFVSSSDSLMCFRTYYAQESIIRRFLYTYICFFLSFFSI